MPDPDLTREALIILRDSLQPKLEALLEHASDDDVETLKEREVLNLNQDVTALELSDPAKILTVLENLPGSRRTLFAGVSDDFVQDRISAVRRLRNRWAHFQPHQSKKARSDVRWLLERSNDADACERLDALASAPRQQRIAQRANEAEAEAGRRANEVAARERDVKKREEVAEQREQSVSEREAKVDEDQEALNEQQRLAAHEREHLDRRRTAVEQREQALERAPAPEDLLTRERNVAADEAVVAQMRTKYEAAQSRVEARRKDMDAQQTVLQRRASALDDRESELDRLRDQADLLAYRLSDSATRLEELERRQRQSDAHRETKPATPAQNGRTTRPRPPGPAPQASVSRLCRRPNCGGQLMEREGKHGKFMGCNNYPECRYSEEVPSDPSQPTQQHGDCPDCESPLVRRQSYRGPFLGCSNYPRCTYTRDLPAQQNSAAPARR